MARRSVPIRHAPATPRPTMADVARHAGVSPSTVSFVVNGRDELGISAATRARVLASVAELGYRPNRHAKGLRTQRSHTIGFVTDEIGIKPPAGQTVAGVHDVARRHDVLPLVVHAVDDQELREVVDDLIDRRVDGLAYAVVGTRRVNGVPALDKVRSILVNCFTTGHDLPCVLPDEAAGGRAATELALRAGHTRIAHLAGPHDSWATIERTRGFRAALRSAGVTDAIVREGNFRSDSGYELARDLLAARGRPTVLVCGNDLMAVGAYFAIKEAGLRIPEDISVVGYDDQEDIASFVTPALTTVRIPYYEMGVTAADLLLGGSGTMSSRTYEQCQVVTRASVAPPARRAR